MDALRQAHEAVVRGGVVLDLMPYKGWIPVENARGIVAYVDQREFARDAKRTEAGLRETVRAGLFALEREVRFDVLEHFDSGPRALEVIGEWGRTRIPARLRAALLRGAPPFSVRETLVLRRLRVQ